MERIKNVFFSRRGLYVHQRNKALMRCAGNEGSGRMYVCVEILRPSQPSGVADLDLRGLLSA